METVETQEEEYKRESDQEPAQHDYMDLVRYAGENGFDRAWVDKMLEEVAGTLVEDLGNGEILLIECTWSSLRQVRDAVHQAAVKAMEDARKKREGAWTPAPQITDWTAEHLLGAMQQIIIRGMEKGITAEQMRRLLPELGLGDNDERTLEKVQKLSNTVEAIIAKFDWALLLIQEEKTTDEKVIDAEEVRTLDAICAKAADCWHYLVEELGWDEKTHYTCAHDFLEALGIGKISIADMESFCAMAVKEGYVENWRGTALTTVDASHNDVDAWCRTLGFVEEAEEQRQIAWTDQQAWRFIASVNMVQTLAMTTLQQAAAIVDQCAQVVEQGMAFKGWRLRSWLEPQLERYEQDTYKKEKEDAEGNLQISHKKGELKKKSFQTLSGDLCVRGEGGFKASTWKVSNWLNQQEEIKKIKEEVETLCKLHISTLPEPLKSLTIIEFNIKANSKAALRLAEDGEVVEGVEYLPKHDTARIMVSPGGRKPLSLKKPLALLSKATKRFQDACTEDSDDDA